MASAVQIVGDEKPISALVETFRGSLKIIDVVWKGGKIDGCLRDLAQSQMRSEKKNFGKSSYLSKGSLIDLIAATAQLSGDGRLRDSQSVTDISYLLPLVKNGGEAHSTVNRYRKSLVVLLFNDTDASAGENSPESKAGRYISILRSLRLPFYHLKETNLAMQVKALEKAIRDGKLPSPFSSLSYKEQYEEHFH